LFLNAGVNGIKLRILFFFRRLKLNANEIRIKLQYFRFSFGSETLVSPRGNKAFKDKIIFFGKAKALLPKIA